MAVSSGTRTYRPSRSFIGGRQRSRGGGRTHRRGISTAFRGARRAWSRLEDQPLPCRQGQHLHSPSFGEVVEGALLLDVLPPPIIIEHDRRSTGELVPEVFCRRDLRIARVHVERQECDTIGVDLREG